MKNIFLIFLGLIFISFSCKKKENEINEPNKNPHNATVMGIGLDCGDAYVIKFNNNVSGLPVNSASNRYYELNLPDEFKIDGMTVYIEFRAPENEEGMLCTTMGASYPQIYITTVE
ncbi:hypothetical protein ERX46_12640 [Brumimicrobium glaciale]|uniref:Uncharacterized protein n=1 Tax=Brumimicrobium glaciale TaxID=200475 RepID=A0A4Q4KJM5_9FLAO|nr:hypothetical protein [Brumimicrobium glaciale]RYM32897.1 hypothetical protein ERX46_12640 [Brumimicrobium glaciale]